MTRKLFSIFIFTWLLIVQVGFSQSPTVVYVSSENGLYVADSTTFHIKNGWIETNNTPLETTTKESPKNNKKAIVKSFESESDSKAKKNITNKHKKIATKKAKANLMPIANSANPFGLQSNFINKLLAVILQNSQNRELEKTNSINIPAYQFQLLVQLYKQKIIKYYFSKKIDNFFKYTYHTNRPPPSRS